MKKVPLLESISISESAVTVRKVTREEGTAFSKAMDDAGLPPDQADLVDIFIHGDPLYGAFVNGKMVGGMTFGKCQPSLKDCTTIHAMIVDPESRGTGVGKELLKFAEKNAKTTWLMTNPHTDEAESFYLKNGYEKDEEFDENDTNVVLKKLK